MARPKKKYHYIYKTTCNLNGKYYIGMHSTSNLEDGYMGSGKRLRYSIRKHGVENHTREILEFLEGRESLAKREAEIVNEELINDPLCMNLKCGGFGGFISKEHQLKCSTAGGKANSDKIKNDPIHRSKFVNLANTSRAKAILNGNFQKPPRWNGKKHKAESKRLIGEKNSIKQKGENNSQFGKCWITNGIESNRIYKGDIIPDGWNLGRKM